MFFELEYLEMTFKQCHFKKFPEALSRIISLVFSKKFHLCSLKNSHNQNFMERSLKSFLLRDSLVNVPKAREG